MQEYPWLARAIALCALAWLSGALAQAPAKPRPGAEPRAVAPRGALAEEEQRHIAVFRAVSPATVHITTIETARDLFSMNVMQVPRGTGSGFLWDERGHVVTNYHVIQGASGARVTLADQSQWPATLVGAFPDRDLAVLRIDAPRDKLKPVLLGTSRDLQVGQKVYAIGNPFGLDQTLTTGIISALNREIDSVNDRRIRGVIQTDAAINPGNSGGPLLDSAGRLIGVNTAIFSPSGASAGIGFAIPVDEVNRVVPRLIRDGKFTRPALGIQTGSAQFHAALRLPKGVAVLGVTPGSPAAAAGITPFRRGRGGDIIVGDLVIAIDGRPVASLDDVLEVLEAHQPGDTVTVALLRAGKTVELRIRLAAAN
ncbi:MAG: trypsin-like peptidase domain-containing protein [Burkholderiales bacterium]|nr:trypsin-like peptidase domain-containing protein [Burkholderiales bacterium]